VSSVSARTRSARKQYPNGKDLVRIVVRVSASKGSNKGRPTAGGSPALISLIPVLNGNVQKTLGLIYDGHHHVDVMLHTPD